MESANQEYPSAPPAVDRGSGGHHSVIGHITGSILATVNTAGRQLWTAYIRPEHPWEQIADHQARLTETVSAILKGLDDCPTTDGGSFNESVQADENLRGEWVQMERLKADLMELEGHHDGSTIRLRDLRSFSKWATWAEASIDLSHLERALVDNIHSRGATWEQMSDWMGGEYMNKEDNSELALSGEGIRGADGPALQ